jgi:Transglycosylase-like domain
VATHSILRNHEGLLMRVRHAKLMSALAAFLAVTVLGIGVVGSSAADASTAANTRAGGVVTFVPSEAPAALGAAFPGQVANPSEMPSATPLEQQRQLIAIERSQRVTQFIDAVNLQVLSESEAAATAFAAATQRAMAQAAAAQAAAAASAAAAAAATPPVAAGSGELGGVWLELRDCESDDDYSIDTGNGYYGAYQFALSTWLGLGYTGLPSDAAPAVQDQAAVRLQARSGWGQWPACSAKLGLT